MMTNAKNACNYEKVNGIGDTNDTDTGDGHTKLSRSNVMRQLLVSSTMWTLYFIYGLQLGAPTVMIPQLQKEANSSTFIDDDLDSWITSMFAFGSLPWAVLLPVILHHIGRKKTFILICIGGFIGGLIIFLSKTITHILVGEFILGIIFGSHNSISPFIITEYSSPKYRGLYMTIKSASGFWGIWVANIIGTFWDWRNIYRLMFICNAYTLTVFAWHESPYWLAKKRRFEDCAKTYRKLKGTSESAKKDLDNIIKSHEFNEDKVEENHSKSSKNFFNSYFQQLSSKAYYGPLFLAILIGMQYYLTGKFIYSMYAIQILKNITQNEAMAYKGMLILDGVTVLSTYCGCALSRFCKRRTMLFTTSFLSIMFLYMFSCYLFLIRQSIIIENNIISITLLVLFSITVSSGPMILLTSIYGELIPFRYQRSCSIAYGGFISVVSVIALKTSLFLFNQLTLPGAFLFYAISSSLVTFILYLYLPETKNKSCYEIENYFNGVDQKDKATIKPDM